MGRSAVVTRVRGVVLAKVLIAVMVLALLAGAYLWFVLSWSYSSGERAGWVQKLSRKGYLCKTWEGELSMVSMPGAAPEKFYFTVWDDHVAEQINQNMGRRVSLHYEEKIGIPSTCFGETRYYVTKVTLVEEIPLAPGIMVPTPRPQPPSSNPAPPSSTAPTTPAPAGSSSGPPNPT